MTDGTAPDSLALAQRIVDLVRERRATDVVLLDVRELVDYTDWFLICSGQSGRQNQAISEHVVKTLKADHRYAISKSGLETGSWVCLDLGDVVVHVFDPETRSRYDLELLWGDAPRVEIAALPTPAAHAGSAPAAFEPAPVEEADAEEAAPKKGPAKRKRVVRKAAVEEADADNAPDSERPPEGEPEPEATPAPAPAVRGRRASSAEALGVVKRAAPTSGRASQAATPKAGASAPSSKGKLSPTPAASRAKASSLPARSKPKASPGPAPKPVAPSKGAKASKPAAKPTPKPAPKSAPKSPKPRKR